MGFSHTISYGLIILLSMHLVIKIKGKGDCFGDVLPISFAPVGPDLLLKLFFPVESYSRNMPCSVLVAISHRWYFSSKASRNSMEGLTP